MSERDDRREDRRYAEEVTYRGRRRTNRIVVPALPWLGKPARAKKPRVAK